MARSAHTTRTPHSKRLYTRDLAEGLREDLDVSRLFARRILASLRRRLIDRMEAGDEIVLSGFGRFHLKRVGAKRMRVAAQNGREYLVQPHACPAWTPSPELRARIRAATTEPTETTRRESGPARRDGGRSARVSTPKCHKRKPQEVGHAQ